MILGRVFVSSVFGGMLDLRQVAGEAARLAGLSPVLTETLVAQPKAVQERLRTEIESCDTYVGLFDRRRGTVPPAGTDHRAITEEEFLVARELGLRCLVFLSKDGVADREPGLAEFLESTVVDYATGVWARPYSTPESLRREIVAAVSAVRPRVALSIRSGQARLFLGGVQPAWTGEAVLGPVAVDLDLGPGTRGVFDAFRRGTPSRNQLRDDDLRAAGSDLAAQALPGPLGEALGQILDQAAGVLVTFEIRTEDDNALALPWELLSPPRHPLPLREGGLEIVRRLLLPGDPEDPAQDPAPSVPPEHLGILGFTSAPAEDQDIEARLGPGGLGDSDLFWEKEQERLLVALDPLLREGRGRLILPDTGDKEELRAQLSRTDRPHLVHIACHGGLEGPLPVLFLEDSAGHRASLNGSELRAWINAVPGADPPGLLVLSACSTAGAASGFSSSPGLRGSAAAAGLEAAGLAESLVRGGLPRVLGMQSTISDPGATAFAEGLYTALGRGTDLPTALRAGRASLAAHGSLHEWAIPTLTIRSDSGPLASPEGLAPAAPTSLDLAREQFKIAGVSYLDQGYVGRREAERRLRKAFRDGEKILVLHGLGGIGKSTLAARFLTRRLNEGARVLTVYAGRALAPAALLDEVAAKVGVTRPAGLPPDVAEEQFREALGQALRAVEPTILLLDNFEDNQDGDGRLLDPALGAALLNLVLLADPTLCVLITSRLAAELPPGPIEPWHLDLGELSPSGCRKLRLLDPEGLGLLEEPAWQRVLQRLGGHPKALELLGGYLHGKTDRVQSLLRKLDQVVEVIDEKLSADLQKRGRKLLVDTVLESVPAERRPSFDRLCLLDVPLPSEELETLLAGEGLSDPGADLSWFRDHGLLARTIAPSALTGGDLVHRLLADRQRTALAEREGEEAVRSWHVRVADHLVHVGRPLSDLGIAAGHRDAAGDRAGALELYNRWALDLRGRHAYAACVQIAREGQSKFSAGNVEKERVGEANLWLCIHDGLEPLGKVEEAGAALDTALRLVETGKSDGASFTRASTRLRRGRLFVQAGLIQEAEAELEKAAADFAEGGYKRDGAVTLGDVARLRAQSGDVSGALKLYEEILSICDDLGDVKGRAVMLGDVARLRAQSGDVSEALKLHEEMLGIFESLGDVRSRAVTLGDVARLRAQSGDVSGALKLHEEEIRTYESLGDVRSRAVTLGDVARLRAQSGDVSGALKLQTERLEVNRRLGDLDGIGAAQYDLAQLDLQEERWEEARGRLKEAWEIFERIGRLDFIAGAGAAYGQLLLATDRSQAITILQTSRDAFQRLGYTQAVSQLDELLSQLG
jgi:tetratricopeptide (TPR) repeat protein